MKKSSKEMYYGASNISMDHAHDLRQGLTYAEDLLWNLIKNRKLNGYKFRRQHPIGRFIADFYCHEAKLVIELDGSIHDSIEKVEYDEGRTFEMNENQIAVLRFSNNEILYEKEKVLAKISNAIQQILSK